MSPEQRIRAYFDACTHGDRPVLGSRTREVGWYRFEDGLVTELGQYWTFDANAPGSQLLCY